MQGKRLFGMVLVLALLMSIRGMSGYAFPATNNAAAANASVLTQNATILYVDGQISGASCTDYDVASRSCGGGTASAYASLNGAAAVTQPGVVVLIRQGTYNEQFEPQTSGTAGDRITYRSYMAEEVSVASSSYPATIILNGVSYLTIEGLTVADHRWLEATDAHHNVIRNNRFLRTPSSGTTGNVRFISSDHNRIVGNVLDDGNDNLLLIDSDYNLVEGNTITEGRHSVFSIRCANYNVIRDNLFSNSQQKIGEIYDCGDDTTIVPHAFDATKHNVIEDNIFAEAVSYYSTSGGNGIQYAGQDGIIRRNVFYHTNAGLAMQVYGDEALYNHYNRVYHNVFYDNECAGLSIREANLDNVYKNNILYKNKGQSGGDCANNSPAQLLYRGTLQAFLFQRNNILHEVPGEAVIQREFGSGDTLATFQSNYPTLFVDNLEIDPGFSDETSYDFALTSGSPMVDAGVFLARAASSGSGTTLTVDDARYFHHGYGIEGVPGDLVQLEGQTEPARVIDVDYAAHTLTLNRAYMEGQSRGQPGLPGSSPGRWCVRVRAGAGPKRHAGPSDDPPDLDGIRHAAHDQHLATGLRERNRYGPCPTYQPTRERAQPHHHRSGQLCLVHGDAGSGRR